MRFPTPDVHFYDAGLERARAFIHAWKDHGRVIPGVAPHAPYTCTDEIFHQAVALAREYDVPLVTHLSETAREVTITKASERMQYDTYFSFTDAAL